MRLGALSFAVFGLAVGGCFPDPPIETDADGKDTLEGNDADLLDGTNQGDDGAPDSQDDPRDTDTATELGETDTGEVDSGCPGPQTRDGGCVEVPAAPRDLRVTPGPTNLTLTWTASADADGYRVSRCAKVVCAEDDFVRLTEAPIVATRHVDETAAGPALPPAPSATASSDATDRVFVSWTSVVTPEAPRYRYRVTAVNAAGESLPSEEAEGQRPADPVSGYELAIGDEAFVAVGAVTSWSDLEAPAPTLTVGTVSASEGTHAAFVRVAAAGYGATAGAQRRYRVRAVTATRQGEVSSEAVGQRQAGVVTLQWERSSGTESANFGSLAMATSATFDDPGAPADGATRWYRVLVSAAGADPVRSVAVPGWRLPPPGVPGGVRATNDLADRVTVTWEAVAGATGYEVSRNGVVVTPAGGIAALSYDDSGAPAPAAWSAPTQLTASTTRTDGIELTWTPPVRPLGAGVDYQVRALNAAGAGPLSAASTGRRAAPALGGFEVERTAPASTGQPLDAEATQWLDAEAPKAIIEPGLISVGFELTRSGVQLGATPASVSEAAQGTYRVRGTLSGGATTPWSGGATGRRAHGAPSARWQRTTSTEATEWSDIPGATTADHLDVQAPLSGDPRWYRVAYVTEGADETFGPHAQGARLGFKSVVPDFARTCALARSGSVWCWDAGGAIRRSDLSEFAVITNRGGDGCGIDLAGDVKCWGSNGLGQLGDGTTEPRAGMVSPIGVGKAAMLASSGGRTCAVRVTGGTLMCWGNEPGAPAVPSPEIPTLVLAASANPLQSVLEAGVALAHGCARLGPSGLIRCWGSNTYGALGDPEPTYFEFAETGPSLDGATQVAVGSAHTCALKGSVAYCWGGNWTGQLGSVGPDTWEPRAIAGLSDLVELRSSGATTCALRQSGTVSCWGSNFSGALGNGSGVDWSPTPVTVSNIQKAASIGVSGGVNCAIQDGGVWCWGSNFFGALGDGTTIDRSTPVQVILP